MKSREIPINDLFKNLQLEWITYFLRKNIYIREVDNKKFTDICRMKQDKIDTFSLRNSIPSIFSSKEKFNKYLFDYFLNEKGLPNFQYTPKNIKFLKFWDKVYYFHVNSIINWNDQEFKVVKNIVNYNKVQILFNNKIRFLNYNDISRNIIKIYSNYIL